MEIKCPHCQNGHGSRVVDSRYDPDKGTRRRRYSCSCSKRFTTYEITDVEYDKIRAMRINEAEIDTVIAALRHIKAQFGDRNGPSKN